MHPRPARTLFAIVLLAGLSACGGGDSGGSSSAPAAAGPPAANVQPGATLIGTLGTANDPDAYQIGLTDSTGAAVTSLPAGAYTITVNDATPIHNWVIEGDGVKEGTSVSGRGSSTFKVSFKPGEYRFHCDPHPSMNGSITVT